MKRAIYVDYENVSLNGLTCVEKLTKDDAVKIFIGKQSAKLSMSDADRIFNCNANIELITNQYIGKNALDFIIMVHLGYDIAKEIADEYFIISKDKGYDPAILEMKKKNGSMIKRCDDINMVVESEKTLGKAILGLLKKGREKESPDTTEHTVFSKTDTTSVDNEKTIDSGKKKQKNTDNNRVKVKDKKYGSKDAAKGENKKSGSKDAVKGENKKSGSKDVVKAENKKSGSKDVVKAENKKGGSKDAAKTERNQYNQNTKSSSVELTGIGQEKNQANLKLVSPKNEEDEKAISENVAGSAGKTGKKKKNNKNRVGKNNIVKNTQASESDLDGIEKNLSKQNSGEQVAKNGVDREKSGENDTNISLQKKLSGGNGTKNTNKKKESGDKRVNNNPQKLSGGEGDIKNTNKKKKSGDIERDKAPDSSNNGEKISSQTDDIAITSNESVIKAEQIRQSHARAKQRRRNRNNELNSYRNSEMPGVKNEEVQASKFERYQSHKLAMVQTVGRIESASEKNNEEEYKDSENQSIMVEGLVGKTDIPVEKDRGIDEKEDVKETKTSSNIANRRKNTGKKKSDDFRRKNKKKSDKHVENVETVNYDSNWKNREPENRLPEKTNKETAEEALRRKEREEAFALLEELEVQEQSEKKAAYIRKRRANRRKNG